jgi:hypothetical protein
MPRRTKVSDVSTVLKAIVRREAQQAAGPNAVLSRAEQAKATPAVRAAADAVRAAGGKGARVTLDALEREASNAAMKLIGTVNNTGSGATWLSKAEATAAFKRDPKLGEPVLRAYEIASGHGVNVDALAKARVFDGLDPDVKFKTFATVEEAERYQDPDGNQVSWLVVTQDNLLSKSYVSGRNDLWSQKFEIDRITGAVAITAEH